MDKFEEAYKKSFEVDGGSIVRNSLFGSFGGKNMNAKMNTIEKMEEVLGAPAEGENRMILRGREEDLRKKICELLETNFSVTIWTKGWTEEEIVTESKMLEEWRIVWCWDEMMEAFLCFRSEEDMKGFYRKLAEEYPSVEFDFVEKGDTI